MIGLDSYSRQVVCYLFGPQFDLYQSLNRLPIWNSQNCSMFPLAFVAGWLQGHWWGFISRNYVVWPTFFLTNVFIALKGSHFWLPLCWWNNGQNNPNLKVIKIRACAEFERPSTFLKMSGNGKCYRRIPLNTVHCLYVEMPQNTVHCLYLLYMRACKGFPVYGIWALFLRFLGVLIFCL